MAIWLFFIIPGNRYNIDFSVYSFFRIHPPPKKKYAPVNTCFIFAMYWEFLDTEIIFVKRTVTIHSFIFFSVRERAVFYKSCDLIGSGSGRYSPIRPAHSGRYPMRDESSITSLTSLQFFINYKDTYHENL